MNFCIIFLTNPIMIFMCESTYFLFDFVRITVGSETCRISYYIYHHRSNAITYFLLGVD